MFSVLDNYQKGIVLIIIFFCFYLSSNVFAIHTLCDNQNVNAGCILADVEYSSADSYLRNPLFFSDLTKIRPVGIGQSEVDIYEDKKGQLWYVKGDFRSDQSISYLQSFLMEMVTKGTILEGNTVDIRLIEGLPHYVASKALEGLVAQCEDYDENVAALYELIIDFLFIDDRKPDNEGYVIRLNQYIPVIFDLDYIGSGPMYFSAQNYLHAGHHFLKPSIRSALHHIASIPVESFREVLYKVAVEIKKFWGKDLDKGLRIIERIELFHEKITYLVMLTALIERTDFSLHTIERILDSNAYLATLPLDTYYSVKFYLQMGLIYQESLRYNEIMQYMQSLRIENNDHEFKNIIEGVLKFNPENNVIKKFLN